MIEIRVKNKGEVFYSNSTSGLKTDIIILFNKHVYDFFTWLICVHVNTDMKTNTDLFSEFWLINVISGHWTF